MKVLAVTCMTLALFASQVAAQGQMTAYSVLVRAEVPVNVLEVVVTDMNDQDFQTLMREEALAEPPSFMR